jgi:hypothetical protein
MTPRKYVSAQAFKEALEQRLRKATTGGGALNRRRQLLVFDRFLARVGAAFGDAMILKGGLVLEVRLERARTTKDIDLRFMGGPGDLLERLQQAGRLDLGDFLTFEIRVDDDHPEIRGDGVVYEGQRFVAECRLAGKLYGQPFGVDVAIGDPIIGELVEVTAEDSLAFVGVPPPRLRLYPIETHIAEKLHAYTLPRNRPNSRIKDLPDIALLATVGPIGSKRLRQALDETFAFRKTHALPATLPDPPAEWAGPYVAMAAADDLAWTTLAEVTGAARAFLDAVLAGASEVRWDPRAWAWR